MSARKSRLQSTELRTEPGDVVIKPVLPGREYIRIQQPGYTLEAPFYEAELIAHSLLEHVGECCSALRERMGP